MPVITIPYTPTQGARIGSAFGKLRGLTATDGSPRPATNTEIETEVKNFVTSVVLEQEGPAAAKAAIAALAALGL